MKVLHLAMHEDSGAGRAASRLHHGLLNQGVESSMLVLQKGSTHPSVSQLNRQSVVLKKIQAKAFGRIFDRLFAGNNTFSINATPSLILNQISAFKADVINLHWVGWEYLRIEDLKRLEVPLVWTLQDMWPFTGGCHYSQTCERYTQACGQCPQLKGKDQREQDISRWVWQRKADAWNALNLSVVAPGHWIADCAKKSALFRNLTVETIPFCLDTAAFSPIPPEVARQHLNLPIDKQLVLFGALSATQDPRKGFQFLLPALKALSQSVCQDRIELVVFGSAAPEQAIDLGFKAHYLGHIGDDTQLAKVYAAADVMVVPSVQESFGQTVSEALACGTPVVAFDTTGPQDIIDHLKTGYLAKPFSVSDLAKGIDWVLQNTERHQRLCIQSRERVEREYVLEKQARAYIALYEKVGAI